MPPLVTQFPGLGDAANARVLRHMAQWALEAREQEKKKQLHSQQQQQLLLPGGLPSRGPTPGGLAPSSTRLDTAGGLSTTAAGGAKSATMVSGSRLVIPAAGVPAAAGAPAAAAAEEEDTELRRIVDVEELAHLWSTADYLQVRGLWRSAQLRSDRLHRHGYYQPGTNTTGLMLLASRSSPYAQQSPFGNCLGTVA